MTPDKQELSRFAAAIFKHADGIVLLQSYPPFDVPWIALGSPHFLEAIAERALEAGNRSASFCPPAHTFNPDGTMREGLCISVDIDADPSDGRRRIERILGPATLVVASGGECRGEPRLHLYWRLARPAVTPSEHAALLDAHRLAARLALADRSLVPLRWPGSVNCKTGRVAKIIFQGDAELDLSEALARLRDPGPLDLKPIDVVGMEMLDQISAFASLIVERAHPDLLARI